MSSNNAHVVTNDYDCVVLNTHLLQYGFLNNGFHLVRDYKETYRNNHNRF